jgi:ribonuclease HII
VPTPYLTIPEIKEQLNNGTFKQEHFTLWKQDPRRGVSCLLARHQRRQQQHDKECVRLEQLLTFEKKLWSQNKALVAGVDEVGAGPLAGPVVAAAVILPVSYTLCGVNDSKKVSPSKREILARTLRQDAIALGIGSCSPKEIDQFNIYQASLLAMHRAIQQLNPEPNHVLIDGRHISALGLPQTRIIGGDARSHTIAAASIIAKVARDHMMEEIAKDYPDYGFERHRGYGTAAHLQALHTLGATPWHRQSFAPVRRATRTMR